MVCHVVGSLKRNYMRALFVLLLLGTLLPRSYASNINNSSTVIDLNSARVERAPSRFVQEYKAKLRIEEALVQDGFLQVKINAIDADEKLLLDLPSLYEGLPLIVIVYPMGLPLFWMKGTQKLVERKSFSKSISDLNVIADLQVSAEGSQELKKFLVALKPTGLKYRLIGDQLTLHGSIHAVLWVLSHPDIVRANSLKPGSCESILNRGVKAL